MTSFPPTDEATPRANVSMKPTKKEEPFFKSLVQVFLMVFIFRMFFLDLFAIDGPSMEPSLQNGDHVVVAKYPYGLSLPFLTGDALVTWGTPVRGDIAIVNSPFDNEFIIKRVVGIPGDKVSVLEDIVSVNGKAIRTKTIGACKANMQLEYSDSCVVYEERLGSRAWQTSDSGDFGAARTMSEMSVPQGHVFIMGDHRDHSNDSRNPGLGMVPISRLRGKALWVYWSAAHPKGFFATLFSEPAKVVSYFKSLRFERFFISVK